MNKILKISALLALLPVVTTSCFKLEQDDIFDKSAAERLNEEADRYENVLTAQGGLWQMEYYANEDMQGYVYLMRFHDNGSVDVAGWNPYIGAVNNGNGSTDNVYGEETSQWDVITDNGPVLTFDTYNKYFHVFSRPDDILNTSGSGGNDGRGFEGDYEFTLLKYSGDTLYIQGKKHGLNMLMTRLPADTDPHTYLGEVVENSTKYFNSLIPRVFLTYPNGKRYVIQDGSELIMTLYEEGVEDPLTNSFTRNGIIGHDTFGFMNPLEYDGFNVQHFLPQADGSLLCIDDNTSTISAGDLARDCFADTLHYMRPRDMSSIDAVKAEKPSDSPVRTTYWEVNTSRTTGALKDAINEFNSQLPKRGAFQQILGAIKFNYVGYPMQSYEIIVETKISQASTLAMKFYYDLEIIGENAMRLTFSGTDEQTTTNAYYDSEAYSGLRHIIEAIMGSYKLTAESLLAPVAMTCTSTTNPDDVMVLNVKRW